MGATVKKCHNCGAAHFPQTNFCTECGQPIVSPNAETVIDSYSATPRDAAAENNDNSVKQNAPSASEASDDRQADQTAPARQSIRSPLQRLGDQRKADVMFVLDCTGSMQGEIDAIRDTIISFAEGIQAGGVQIRVGLIEFRDRLINEEPRVLNFAGQPFTDVPAAFRQAVAALRAEGGGDDPESSLDALMLALRQPFAPDAQKVIVLVTDAPPHIPDKETQNLTEVVWTLRAAAVQQLYMVLRLSEERNLVYLKLLEGARGLAFDLGEGEDFRRRAEHFKRTLMNLGQTISQATR